MKFLYLFSFTLFLMTSCQAQDQTNSTAMATTGSKIEVLDFHTTHRCKTCMKIEENAKAVLQKDFQEAVEAGKITFQTINIDKKENAKIAEHFQVGGTALFLNVVKEGVETPIDLTDFAFMKAFDEEAFFAELKTKIEEQLNAL